MIAGTAATLGSNVGWYFSQSQLLVVLGPEHAATIAEDGLTGADVQRSIYEQARLPLRRRKLGGMWGIHDWPRWMDDRRRRRPPARSSPGPTTSSSWWPAEPGKHSSVIPNCCFSRAVTRRIARWPR